VTNHYVAFNGWPDTKVLISLKEIKSVEKSKATKSNNLKNLAENNPDVETAINDIFSAFKTE
jgi:hypothetical protein